MQGTRSYLSRMVLLNESIQVEHIVFTGILAVTPFYLSEKWPRNHSTNVLLSHMPYDGRIAHTRLLDYMYELSPDLRFVFCGHDHTR